MNGYDAIMQGRHSLRNTTQPSDTEYGLLSVYSFRGNDKRGERREERKIRHELYRPRVFRFVDRLQEFLQISLYPRNDLAMHASSDEKRAILVKQLSRMRKSDADRDLCACSVRTNELHVVRSELKCLR